MTGDAIVYAVLAGVAIAGGLITVFTRDITRMMIGLGAFLLALAGFFVYWGAVFLGAVQLFVYVGGVLVLFVFAIMLVHRGSDGSPRLETRHDVAALTVAGGVFFMVVSTLQDVAPRGVEGAIDSDTARIAEVFLGPMLTHFEMAGVLLLAVLVAVVVIVGGREK